MRLSCKSLLLACACAALAATPAAYAEKTQWTASEASVMVVGMSAVMVVSGPLFLSAAGVNAALEASSAAGDRRQQRRLAAGPLPDMLVQQVGSTADGGRMVTLVDPGNAQNTAELAWPARSDDPAAGFQPGQQVRFDPSSGGSGWLLHDAAGSGPALAYVPTLQAAGDSYSQAL